MTSRDKATGADLPLPSPPRQDWIGRTAVLRAWVGGVILVALSVLVTLSVLGRWLLGREIPGAFEFVQVGVAVASFLFLPVCQVRNQNIVVDSFTAGASQRVRFVLDGSWALLYAIVALVLAWRLFLGAEETIRYKMVTSMVQLPFGWAMFAGAAALLFLALASTAVALGYLRKG